MTDFPEHLEDDPKPEHVGGPVEAISKTIHEVFNVNIVDVDPPQSAMPITILVFTNPLTRHSDEYVVTREAGRKIGARLMGSAFVTAPANALDSLRRQGNGPPLG